MFASFHAAETKRFRKTAVTGPPIEKDTRITGLPPFLQEKKTPRLSF
jgi:hypothetical protein